jgi:stage II sporulation protein D
MKRFLIITIFVLSINNCFAQKINVSLFNDLNVQTLLITPVSGKYSIITDDGVFSLSPNQIVYISRTTDSIKVRDMASHIGTWKRVSVVGQTDKDVIRVSPIVPSMPARVYDDNLGFYVDFNRVMTLNIIDIDKYVAGVVEAESGPSAHLEFYKAQALLARTYALGHIERHAGEGFNLCDQVHCQAYKGKSVRNPAIVNATKETKDQVIIDSENNLIVGAFHANCGGHTANAGDVWLSHKPYLVTISDPYCRSQPSSQWEVRIPMEQWTDFLKSKSIDVDNLNLSNYNFTSKDREYFYPIDGKRIPLTDIRNHFSLRSSYFSVDVVSGNIRIRGRGYGHGVGMCQDGAIQMARRGRSYKDILFHYYKNISIVNFSESNGFGIEPQDDISN